MQSMDDYTQTQIEESFVQPARTCQSSSLLTNMSEDMLDTTRTMPPGMDSAIGACPVHARGAFENF